MRCIVTGLLGVMLISMTLPGCSDPAPAPPMETTGPNQVVMHVPGMS